MNLLSPRGKWILKNVSGKRILDIGFAGSGDEPDDLFQALLVAFPDKYIAGVDVNAAKVAKLHRKNTIAGNGKNLPFTDQSFDCVVLAEVVEHQTEVLPFLTEAFRVLRSDGKFLMTTPNPYGIFRWLKNFLFSSKVSSKRNIDDFLGFRGHEMFFEPISIINLLYRSGFKNVEFTTTNPSFPYLPKMFREPNLPFWPFNRLGTYACYKAAK